MFNYKLAIYNIRNNKFYSFSVKLPNKLDPYWITGFSDAEGCFTVILSSRTNSSWRVKVSF